MSTNTLFRLAGLTALVAGITALFSSMGAAAGIVPAAVDGYRSFATILLNLFALTGIYAAQSHKAGTLGLISYVLSTLGLAGNVGLRFVYLLVAPILIAGYPDAAAAAGNGPLMAATSITFLVYAVGFILFGISVWRAGIFPRWAGAAVSVGALLSYLLVMLPINVGGMLVSIGMIGIGWALTNGNKEFVKSSQQQMVRP